MGQIPPQIFGYGRNNLEPLLNGLKKPETEVTKDKTMVDRKDNGWVEVQRDMERGSYGNEKIPRITIGK